MMNSSVGICSQNNQIWKVPKVFVGDTGNLVIRNSAVEKEKSALGSKKSQL